MLSRNVMRSNVWLVPPGNLCLVSYITRFSGYVFYSSLILFRFVISFFELVGECKSVSAWRSLSKV